MTHKMSHLIECFAMIIEEDTGIDADMYNQEKYQKNTCKCHQQFLADGGAEKLIPLHNRNSCKNDVANLQLLKRMEKKAISFSVEK